MSIFNLIKTYFESEPTIYTPYKDQEVIEIKWWFHDYADSIFYWARLRVFSNGQTDVLFENEDKLYGFENEEFAGYFLSEDEYMSFDKLDKEDLIDLEVPKGTILELPKWENKKAKYFEYIGKY